MKGKHLYGFLEGNCELKTAFFGAFWPFGNCEDMKEAMRTVLSRQKRAIWCSADFFRSFSLICRFFKKYLKIVLDLNLLSWYLKLNLHRLKTWCVYPYTRKIRQWARKEEWAYKRYSPVVLSAGTFCSIIRYRG